MLSRKIEKDIINWFENENKALLIDGARQVYLKKQKISFTKVSQT